MAVKCITQWFGGEVAGGYRQIEPARKSGGVEPFLIPSCDCWDVSSSFDGLMTITKHH